MNLDIYEIGPDKVVDQIAALATHMNLDEWTAREAAAFVIASVMANVAFALYTTLPMDIDERTGLAQAGQEAFKLALAEAERP